MPRDRGWTVRGDGDRLPLVVVTVVVRRCGARFRGAGRRRRGAARRVRKRAARVAVGCGSARGQGADLAAVGQLRNASLGEGTFKISLTVITPTSHTGQNALPGTVLTIVWVRS
jgi:hypothetical protein